MEQSNTKTSPAPENQVLQPVVLETIHKELTDWFTGFSVKSSDGVTTPVRVITVSSEKWDISKNKFILRDENDRLILPLIALYPKDPIMEDSSGVAGFNKSAAHDKGWMSVRKRYIYEGQLEATNQRQRELNGEMTTKIPLTGQQIWMEQLIPAPTFIKRAYQILFKAQYVEDMANIELQFYNKAPARNVFNLPHAVVYVPNGFSQPNNWNDQTKGERIVEANMNLDVNCWVLPDLSNQDSNIKEKPSISFLELNWDTERTSK